MSNIEYYTTEHAPGRARGRRSFTTGSTERANGSQPARGSGPLGMIETAENLAGNIKSRARRRRLRGAKPSTSKSGLGAACSPKRSCRSSCREEGEQSCRRARRGHQADSSHPSAARPIMPGGVVTAGNVSQQNDAAPPPCLVVAEDRLDALGLQVRSAFS